MTGHMIRGYAGCLLATWQQEGCTQQFGKLGSTVTLVKCSDSSQMLPMPKLYTMVTSGNFFLHGSQQQCACK